MDKATIAGIVEASVEKTLDSFGYNNETFIVAAFVLVCASAGVWWKWLRRVHQEGAVTIPEPHKVRSFIRAVLAGCIPLVLVFAVNVFRVARDTENRLIGERDAAQGERDGAKAQAAEAIKQQGEALKRLKESEATLSTAQTYIKSLEGQLGILTAIRPTFASVSSRIDEIRDPRDKEKVLGYQIHLPLVQKSEHPASEVKGRLWVIDQRLDAKPILNDVVEFVNDIQKDGPLNIRGPQQPLQTFANPIFVVLTLDYRDVVTGKPAPSQSWFYRAAGVKEGFLSLILSGATSDQKVRIENYMKKNY